MLVMVTHIYYKPEKVIIRNFNFQRFIFDILFRQMTRKNFYFKNVDELIKVDIICLDTIYISYFNG